jgi:hypothetical protein
VQFIFVYSVRYLNNVDYRYIVRFVTTTFTDTLGRRKNRGTLRERIIRTLLVEAKRYTHKVQACQDGRRPLFRGRMNSQQIPRPKMVKGTGSQTIRGSSTMATN